MPRKSETAIERNRQQSRERYRANRDDYRAAGDSRRQASHEQREFIGWDGEGYNAYVCYPGGEIEIQHRYMLFGASTGHYALNIDLSTQVCLDLILMVEQENPEAFHVGFSFEYDVNMILRDLPWRMLAVLKETGKVRWNGYKIKHVPHKLFQVSKGEGDARRCAVVYDCFGYFHSSYVAALRKFSVGDKDMLGRIEAGKLKRGHFTWADREEILGYWGSEISLLPPLMDCIRDAAYGGGFRISVWHGPGALASYALRHHRVSEYKSKDMPPVVKEAIRYAYAGGRFEPWQCGHYEGPVYTLDKNSAYVHAISLLPRLDNGKWVRRDPGSVHGPENISRFGLYHILYDARGDNHGARARRSGLPEPPHPLFHRSETGRLSWPNMVDGWYWSPEARLVAGDPNARFLESFEYQDDGSYPFEWVAKYYDVRLLLQEAGNPAEKAYKWLLAAMYGAFARRVGWDTRRKLPPRSHELAWAGWTTSHCRADIQPVAEYAWKQGGLVSVDTDGVTSLVPFKESLVDLGFGSSLGQWKQEDFSGLLYWQNGIYWLRDTETGNWGEAKSRGIPRGMVPLDSAMGALETADFSPPYKPAVINVKKTRFVGYRQALNQQHNRWCRWEPQDVDIRMGGNGKALHLPMFCRLCHGIKDVAKMHTVTKIQPVTVASAPHNLPWLDKEPEDMEQGEIMELLGAGL